MDVDNSKSWVAQPDVCRCCLSTSGTWDLTTSYITEVGIKEVFSDILQECYGITLSCLSEWGPSHLICESCTGRLRIAATFKKQVLTAEECFLDYINRRRESPDIKKELDEDYCNEYWDGPTSEDDKINIPQNNSEGETETQQYESCIRKGQKSKKRRKCRNVECDSDVPIAELKKDSSTESKENLENVDVLKENESNEISYTKVDFPAKGLQHQPVCAKQISERKRVMITCETVLTDTTACPFRHHKSWFQCFYCTDEFMDMTSLKTHISENHKDTETELRKMKRYPRSLQIDISNLECRICRENLTDVESMRRHFETVHDKVIYNDCIADYKVNCSPYFCHLCNQEFHVFRTLTTHLNEHYANCICDVCGRSFLNSKRLKVHKRNHENGQFPCSECGKILKTKTSKANHMESAHSKRVIKCQICSKPMKHYNDRIKHMSEAHNITHMFKCNICSKEYNIKHYLATHMRQTHGNKNKKCMECGMAFITNHGLKKHMSKHTGVKPHKCGVCGKAYARSYTLREHMRAHETDKRFLCNE